MDATTFQAEAEKYERLMFQISWSMLRNSEDCADAVQDALIKAWQKRDTLHDEERFKPWLMRILHNTCKDMLRRRKKVRFGVLRRTDPDRSAPGSAHARKRGH